MYTFSPLQFNTAVQLSSCALVCMHVAGDSVDVSPVMGKGFDMAKLSAAGKYSTVGLHVSQCV